MAVVKDATATAKVPEGDGYQAALVNFRFIANTVWTPEEAVEKGYREGHPLREVRYPKPPIDA